MKTTTILGALALAGATACGAAPTATIDFTAPTGPINKWLHCSGYGPRSYPRSLENDDKDLAALHLTAARTHDWALINDGQRCRAFTSFTSAAQSGVAAAIAASRTSFAIRFMLTFLHSPSGGGNGASLPQIRACRNGGTLGESLPNSQ